MIYSLLVTILIEGIVVLAYCLYQKKSAGSLLVASVFVNLFTQVVLWIVLIILYRHYAAALLTTEFIIWLAESFLMSRLSRGQLMLKNAMVLSLCMNAASFGVGWFLPI